MSSWGSTAADVAASAFAIVASSMDLSVENVFHRGQPQRPIADADDADMGIARLATLVLIIEHRCRGHREVAAAAGEFLEPPAPAGGPGRKADLHDDLVCCQCRRQSSLEEIGCLNHMRAGFSNDGNLGIAGHGDPGHFGGRIGMGNAAANRAAVADLIMRDVGDRGLEQRMRGLEPFVVLDVAPAHHGAERDARIRNPDSAQIGELAQVDKQRGLGEAEGEHRHQALAACDRLGVVVRGEEFDRFRECGRAGIVEGRQFHDLDASFALHATRSTWRLVPIIGSKHRSTRCATPACDRLVLSPGSVRLPRRDRLYLADVSRANINIRRVQHADDPWISPLAGWHQRR